MALNYRITKSEQVVFPPSVTSGEFVFFKMKNLPFDYLTNSGLCAY